MKKYQMHFKHFDYRLWYDKASLRKMLFPVYRLGEYVRADRELYFPLLQIFLFPIFFLLFSYKRKKKEKILRLRDWPQFWSPTGQETNVFKGGLKQQTYKCEHPTWFVCRSPRPFAASPSGGRGRRPGSLVVLPHRRVNIGINLK